MLHLWKYLHCDSRDSFWLVLWFLRCPISVVSSQFFSVPRALRLGSFYHLSGRISCVLCSTAQRHIKRIESIFAEDFKYQVTYYEWISNFCQETSFADKTMMQNARYFTISHTNLNTRMFSCAYFMVMSVFFSISRKWQMLRFEEIKTPRKCLFSPKKMDKFNCLATRKTAGTHKPRSTEDSPRNYFQMHFFQTRALILSIKNHKSFMWTRLTHHENKRKYCGPFSNFVGFSMSYRQNFPLLLVR